MGIEEFLINRATKEGIQQGRELEAELKHCSFVTTLMKDTNFSSEKIAHLVGVSLAFVEKVKKELDIK